MPSGIVVSSPQLLSLAEKAKYRAHGGEGDQTIVACVLAISALEALLNELPELFSAPGLTRARDLLHNCVPVLRELEEKRESMVLKISIFHALVPRKPFERGVAPWQDLDALILVRNAIIHRRPSVVYLDKATGSPELKQPRLPQLLAQRGLAESDTSWGQLLGRPAVAAWAVSTVTDCISRIVELIPDSAPRDILRHAFDLDGTYNLRTAKPFAIRA